MRTEIDELRGRLVDAEGAVAQATVLESKFEEMKEDMDKKI